MDSPPKTAVFFLSTLALLMLGVFANNPHDSTPLDQFAFIADLFD